MHLATLTTQGVLLPGILVRQISGFSQELAFNPVVFTPEDVCLSSYLYLRPTPTFIDRMGNDRLPRMYVAADARGGLLLVVYEQNLHEPEVNHIAASYLAELVDILKLPGHKNPAAALWKIEEGGWILVEKGRISWMPDVGFSFQTAEIIGKDRREWPINKTSSPSF